MGGNLDRRHSSHGGRTTSRNSRTSRNSNWTTSIYSTKSELDENASNVYINDYDSERSSC